MADKQQDPVALLERICRLESSMDPNMIVEEEQPTVKMGQDGFALALTQAKLSRLEANYQTLAERYLALRGRFVKLQQHCMVLKQRIKDQSSSKRSTHASTSADNDSDTESALKSVDGSTSSRRRDKERREKEKKQKKDRSPRSEKVSSSSSNPSSTNALSTTRSPSERSGTTTPVSPKAAHPSLTASMTNIALVNPPPSLEEDLSPVRKPTNAGGTTPPTSPSSTATSPLSLPKQVTSPALARPTRTASNLSAAATPPTTPTQPALVPAPLPLPDSDPGAIKRGWLLKLRKSCVKRLWFVITAGGAEGAELSWRVSDRPGPRKGYCLLKSALISVPKAHVDPNIPIRSHTLLVRPSRGSRTKPLFVSANDQPELIQWLDALLAAAHKE